MSPKLMNNAADLDVSFGQGASTAELGALDMAEGPKSRGSSVAKLRALFTAGAATVGAAAAMGQTLFFDHGLNSDNKQIYDSGITAQRIGNFFTITSVNPLEERFSYTMTGGARKADGSFTGGSDIWNVSDYRLELFTRDIGGVFNNDTPSWSSSGLIPTGRESISGTAIDNGPYHTLNFSGQSTSLVNVLNQNVGKEAMIVITGLSGGGFNFVTFASNVQTPNPQLSWANDTSTNMPWTSFQDLGEIQQATGKFEMSQPVPEPGTVLGLAAGAAALLGRRRKKDN